MASALAVVLVMAAGELEDPSGRAIGPALTTAARQEVALTMRESARVPDEADVPRVAASARASLVVEVAWQSPARERAIVHLHDAEGDLVSSTVLTFRETQSLGERGRAIGLAVGTMLPSARSSGAIGAAFPADVDRSAVASEPEASAPPPATTPPPASPPADRVPSERRPSSREEPERSFFSVGANGVAVTNLGRGPSGLGGAGHVEIALSETIAIRAGALGRAYSSDGRTANEVGPFAGLAWTFVHVGAFSLRARAEALVLRNSYPWTNPAGKLATRSAWIFGGAATVEAAFRLARPLEVYLAPSLEIANRALTDPQVVASSPAWATLELGARLSF